MEPGLYLLTAGRANTFSQYTSCVQNPGTFSCSLVRVSKVVKIGRPRQLPSHSNSLVIERFNLYLIAECPVALAIKVVESCDLH